MRLAFFIFAAVVRASHACSWRDIQILGTPDQDLRDVESAVVSCYASEFLEGATARQKSSDAAARAFVNDKMVVIVDENVNLRVALRDAVQQVGTMEPVQTTIAPRGYLLSESGVVGVASAPPKKKALANALTLLGNALGGEQSRHLNEKEYESEANTVEVESVETRIPWRTSSQVLENLWTRANLDLYDFNEEDIESNEGGNAESIDEDAQNVALEKAAAAGIHVVTDSPLINALYDYESQLAPYEQDSYVRFDDPPSEDVPQFAGITDSPEGDEFFRFSISSWKSWPDHPTSTSTIPTTVSTVGATTTRHHHCHNCVGETTTSTRTHHCHNCVGETTTSTRTHHCHTCVGETTTTTCPTTTTTTTTTRTIHNPPTTTTTCPTTTTTRTIQNPPTTTTTCPTTTTTTTTCPPTTTTTTTTTPGSIEVEIPNSGNNGTIVITLPSDIALWFNSNTNAPQKQKAKLLAHLLGVDTPQHSKKLRGSTTTTTTTPLVNGGSLSDRFQQLRSALLTKALALSHEEVDMNETDTFLSRYLRTVDGGMEMPDNLVDRDFVEQTPAWEEEVSSSTRAAWYEVPKNTIGKFFGVWDVKN